MNVETPAVPASSDQVDVNVTVKERPTGNVLFGVGYSNADGVLFNTSISESNLFGTGKELSASFDNTRSATNFNVRYVDPYFTDAGISRGINLFSSQVDAAEADTAAYNTKTVGGGVFFGIPLSEDHRLTIGGDVERVRISIRDSTAQIAQDYVTKYGDDNNFYKLTLGWSYDTLDNPIAPKSGSLQRISGEIAVPGSDVEYYKLTLAAGRYWEVFDDVSFKVKGELGYGAGYGDSNEIPFFKNFYAGGSNSVRGYKSRSLGPRDTRSPFGPVGGDRRVLLNTELLFPMPGASATDKSMRLSLFVDGGMVFGPGQDLDLGELRYSSGLAFNWFSPIGPLSFSYAFPLNDKPGDDTESFQFTLGVPLR